ncbi:MAG: hypothetical protein V4667_09970 [Bacteroidota bacterium]
MKLKITLLILVLSVISVQAQIKIKVPAVKIENKQEKSQPEKAKSSSSNSSTTSSSEAAYKVNDKVSIEENAKWYPGYIMEVNGDKYKIHYDGYDPKYDTWVTTARLKSLGGSNSSSTSSSTTSTSSASSGTFRVGDLVEYFYRDKWVDAEVVSPISSAGRYQVKFSESMYEYAYPKELKATSKKNAEDTRNEATKARMASYGTLYKEGEQVWINSPSNGVDNFIGTIVSSQNVESKDYYDVKRETGTIKVKHTEILSKYDASNTEQNRKMMIPKNSYPTPANGEIIEYLDAKFNVCDITQSKYCRVYKPAGPNKAVNDDISFYYKNGQLYWKCKCIYIDKVNSEKDKYVGLITIYKENGEEDQIALFDKAGNREYYGDPQQLKNAKYKIGEEVQLLTSSGDQEAWVPAVIIWPKGSDAYLVSTPNYANTFGNKSTYESYIRPANMPITYIYGKGLTPGPAEAHIQNLAKNELLALRPGATIIKNEMNSREWSITLDVFKIPDHRTKNGRMLFKMPDGELRAIYYVYSETYINGGGYQKKNSLDGLNGEIPVKSYQ